MKRFTLFLSILTLVLASCGSDGSKFTVEGRMLNLNQGEFYVYSTDGMILGMDTIHVQGGRFSYSINAQSEGTLVIVFPNFSEQPVFVKPGKKVEMKADASSLKELTVKGSDQNELMNKFRDMVLTASPPEAANLASTFIKDHPESLVSLYLLRRYFINTQEPDYQEAKLLIDSISKAQPDNIQAISLKQTISNLHASGNGQKLPAFKCKDIEGNEISEKDFSTDYAVIYLWASWDYESTSFQRMLKDYNKDRTNKIPMLGICIDASEKDSKKKAEDDKIECHIVCDEKGMNGDLVKKLAFETLPDVILIKDGKISERGLNIQEIKDKILK